MAEIEQALEHHRAGRLPQAEALYRRLLRSQPNHPDALHLLGVLAHQAGKHEAAVELIGRAIGVNADVPDYHNNLGEALRALKKFDAAIAAYQHALTLKWDYADAHSNLGVALQEQGKLAEAITAFERALALRPAFETYYNLGNALKTQGKQVEAIAAYRRALALKPDLAEALNNIGAILREQGELTEAIATYRRALALKPDSAEVYYNLGNALADQGKPDRAISAYRQALTFKPDFAEAHSNLLHCLHYRTDLEPANVLAEHRRWAEHHAAPLGKTLQPHPNSPDPERRLRIGYVSPDFRRHSVAFFIEPLLMAHDRNGFEVICYANVSRADDVTERFQSLADRWRDIVPSSDEQVAELVRADSVDILVDLAGHTASNRLLVFARKPAPVQAAYLGYPNTRGFSTLDYWLTDTLADPPGAEQFYVEDIVRLAQGFNCYQPPAKAPDVALPPVLSNDHVTFASFNNATKISSEVAALWSNILQALPQARLIIKAHQLGDPETRDNFRKLFAQQGILPERFEFFGRISSLAEHLALYNHVDIALDCFPYNGHTTTCEALWMGVPVITLAGHTHAARVGVSLLSHVGLPELIAQTPEAYVKLATQLATDVERLRDLRAGLREKMKHSLLTDATGFTRSVETAYRMMWRRWCSCKT